MADGIVSGITSPLGRALLLSDAVGVSDQGSVRFPIMLGKSGGIGFQYEGGIITVTATKPNLNVSFDRPMTYNGDFSQVPDSKPYSIGQPALTPMSLSIDIPITVPPNTFQIDTFVASPTELRFVYPDPITILSREGFYVIPHLGVGTPVAILSIELEDPVTLLVTTTEHQQDIVYRAHIPPGVLSSAGGLNEAYDIVYDGVGAAPTIYSSQFTSPTSVLVTYSEPMEDATALAVSNYSIPGLTIYSVTKQGPSTYVLRTSVMVPSTNYTLTITGVRDLAKNPV